MSKRPTVTNQLAAKHWTFAMEPIMSAAEGETAGASTAVVPGWLPRVEPELVRSSLSDSSRVIPSNLPEVDAELVRNTEEDSFVPATDCRITEESEMINESNGDSDGVGIEAPCQVEPEIVSITEVERSAVAAAPLPLTESEATNTASTEPVAISDSLAVTEPEVASITQVEAAAASADPSPSTASGTAETEPTAITANPLALIQAETASISKPEIAPEIADTLALVEPQAQSITPLAAQQIASRTAEWNPPKTIEPSRDFESTNGYRHISLSANEEARLVFQTEPNGLAAEQYRLLRRTLTREFENGAVLLITSPAMGDGKTLTSVNLASCFAESGQPTLLVEADIRRPSIRRILSAEVEPPGVEDVLSRKVEPRRAVHGIKELNLYAAMVSHIPDNPAQLIGGPGVKQFLAWARENFLWVVLDAPPTLPAADVSELLPFADAAVLVVRAQSTPRELAKQSIESLGKHLRGVIFNEVTVDSNPHYRYLNNYYYTAASDSKSGTGRLVKYTKSA